MSLDEQQEVARAMAAHDDANTGVPRLTAAGNVRGRATVGCGGAPGSEEARGAFQILARLPQPENLPVKLQNCVAACGLPSAAEAAPTALEIAARRATVSAKSALSETQRHTERQRDKRVSTARQQRQQQQQ